MTKTVNIEMYKVSGVDLRNSEPFSEWQAVEKGTNVKAIYTRLGFGVEATELIGERSIEVNLNELYLGDMTKDTLSEQDEQSLNLSQKARDAIDESLDDNTAQEDTPGSEPPLTTPPEPASGGKRPRKTSAQKDGNRPVSHDSTPQAIAAAEKTRICAELDELHEKYNYVGLKEIERQSGKKVSVETLQSILKGEIGPRIDVWRVIGQAIDRIKKDFEAPGIDDPGEVAEAGTHE